MRVYFHIAGMGNYREVVAELSGAVEGSGLYDESDSLIAVTTGGAIVADLMGERWEIIDTGLGVDSYEFPTLERIHADGPNYPVDPFLYIHTKGVSRFGSRAAIGNAWRRYMVKVVIASWRECVDLLYDWDTVGTEYRRLGGRHYAGNFWWARGEFIAKLPAPVPKIIANWPSVRYASEMWLLSSGPRSKAYSFHRVNVKLERQLITESMYRGTQRAT